MLKAIFRVISLLSFTAVAQGVTTVDIAQGRAIYATCMGCHSPERHRTGPQHCGLIGRKAGSAVGFDYSLAMQQSDIIWTKKTLDDFLTAPLRVIPGTKMAIAGISNKVDRANLISYLISLNQDAKCQYKEIP